MIINLQKSNTETELQYIWRLCQAKDAGSLDMTWTELADVFNKNLSDIHEEWTEAAYRKKFQQSQAFYEDVFSKMIDDQYSDEIMAQKRELERAKIAFRDERNAWQKQNYADTRASDKLDKLEEYIKSSSTDMKVSKHTITVTDKTLVVCLSDWHIGAEYYSFNGTYNSDIAEERLGHLLAEVISIAERHGASNCRVCCVGDLLSGNIHQSIAITNRENVIEQIVKSAKLLSDFILNLSPHFYYIYLCGVSGNHSRITKKDDALKDERLDYLPLWYAKAKLDSCPNVTVQLEELDSTVATFEANGKFFLVLHGDYDGFNDSAVAKLVLWLGYKPDVIIFGHKHYPAMSECAGITMVQCGSLGGSGDDFTQQKRLKGDASQTVLVCDDTGVVCCYPIKLS